MICKYVYVYAYIIKQTITQTCKHLLISVDGGIEGPFINGVYKHKMTEKSQKVVF